MAEKPTAAIELFDEADRPLGRGDLVNYKHYRMRVKGIGRVVGKPNLVPVELEDIHQSIRALSVRTVFASETSPGRFRLPCTVARAAHIPEGPDAH